MYTNLYIFTLCACAVYTVLLNLRDNLDAAQFYMLIHTMPIAFSLYLQVSTYMHFKNFYFVFFKNLLYVNSLHIFMDMHMCVCVCVHVWVTDRVAHSVFVCMLSKYENYTLYWVFIFFTNFHSDSNNDIILFFQQRNNKWHFFCCSTVDTKTYRWWNNFGSKKIIQMKSPLPKLFAPIHKM